MHRVNQLRHGRRPRANESVRSRWECCICLPFVETSGHQRLRCDARLEVGVRKRAPVWNLVQVSLSSRLRGNASQESNHSITRSVSFGNERFKPRHGK